MQACHLGHFIDASLYILGREENADNLRKQIANEKEPDIRCDLRHNLREPSPGMTSFVTLLSEELGKKPSIEVFLLMLRRVDLSDEAMNTLCKLLENNRIARLDLYGTQLTPEQLDKLKAAIAKNISCFYLNLREVGANVNVPDFKAYPYHPDHEGKIVLPRDVQT